MSENALYFGFGKLCALPIGPLEVAGLEEDLATTGLHGIKYLENTVYCLSRFHASVALEFARNKRNVCFGR